MIDQVYNAKLLEFAGNISKLGVLDDFDATASAHSKLCGSKLTVWLSFNEDHIVDFSHEVKACALGQASASIVAANIIGARGAELRMVRDQMWAMLSNNARPPEGRFADLKYLEPVRDFKARHASTMLCLDAVVDALNKIDGHNDGQTQQSNKGVRRV